MIPRMISLIIPTLNAATSLGPTLQAVGRPSDLIEEVVVVDGGSVDDTVAIAKASGARVIAAPTGRGVQLAAGAAAARGEWLLFLHADTRLEPGWQAQVAAFVAARGAERRAAAFRFALDDTGPAARWVEAVVAWRCRWFGLPYGDQGLIISRSFYRKLGGYRSMPLMEDVDLARRIGRRGLHLLDARAVTSAARYRRDGYLQRSLRNLVCLGLYLAGVSPVRIAHLYE